MFFIKVFHLYEYMNGIIKYPIKIGYGVVFPNNKTILNLYSTEMPIIYDTFEEFKSINYKGNRYLSFIHLMEQIEDDDDE